MQPRISFNGLRYMCLGRKKGVLRGVQGSRGPPHAMTELCVCVFNHPDVLSGVDSNRGYPYPPRKRARLLGSGLDLSFRFCLLKHLTLTLTSL